MYLEHFHLTRSPFEEELDLQVFFPGGGRESTLNALVSNILAGKPLIKFIGREGSGKSLICQLLINHSLADHDIVYLDNPIGSFDDLLRIICLDLGMNPAGSHESVNFLQELHVLINQRREEGKKVLVIVDEAEKLFLATLERLVRTICETEEASTLRIVLSGRPGLDVNLEQLSIYCANVDINAGHSLAPLTEEETGEYLIYRLEAAGLSVDKQDEIFTNAAVAKIHASSQGNLRLINILAEEALQKSCTDKSFMVLLDHVEVEPESDHNGVNFLDSIREKVDTLYASCMENRLLAGAGLGAALLVIMIGLLVSGGEDEPQTKGQVEVRIEREVIPPQEKVAEPAIKEGEPQVVEEVATEPPQPEPVEEVIEEVIDEVVAEPPPTVAEEELEEVIEPLETEPERPEKTMVAQQEEVPPAEITQAPRAEEPGVVIVGPERKKRPVNEPKNIEIQHTESVRPVKQVTAQSEPKIIANNRDGDILFKERRRASVSWLAEAYRGSYTIQLMMLTSNQAERNLKKMLVKDEYYAIKENLYILRKKTTPPTLFVYYGIYSSMNQARHERNTMPVFLRKHHPYALAISDALKKTED